MKGVQQMRCDKRSRIQVGLLVVMTVVLSFAAGREALGTDGTCPSCQFWTNGGCEPVVCPDCEYCTGGTNCAPCNSGQECCGKKCISKCNADQCKACDGTKCASICDGVCE